MKVETEAKFQGLQLLPNELFRFSIGKLTNIEFCSGKRTILPVTRSQLATDFGSSGSFLPSAKRSSKFKDTLPEEKKIRFN